MVPLGGIRSAVRRSGGTPRTVPPGGGCSGPRGSACDTWGMGPVSGTRSGGDCGGSGSPNWSGVAAPRSHGATGGRRRDESSPAGSRWRGSSYSLIGPPAPGGRARTRRRTHPGTTGHPERSCRVRPRPLGRCTGSWCLLSLQDPRPRAQISVQSASLPRVQPLVGRIGLSPEAPPQAATGQQEQQCTGTCGNYRQR